MTDAAFYLLVIDVAAMAALLASLVIQLKRIGERAFSEALNGIAESVR